MIRRVWVLPAFVLLTLGAATTSSVAQEELPVTWRSAEVKTLASDAVEGMEYKIVVTLPGGYADSTERYPVVYYLDAWYMAGGIEETYRWLRAFDDIPPLILVGISFQADGGQALYLRARDYVPTEVSPEDMSPYYASVTPASGGASEFLKFIKDELIPFVEGGYRVDPTDRGLLGYSHGGLFSSWVLFNAPELFQRYLIGSPSSDWDDYVVLDDEAAYAERSSSLPARVFLSIGGEEDRTGFDRLKKRLESRGYEGLELTTMVFEDETHTSAIPGTYSRAFRILYGRQP